MSDQVLKGLAGFVHSSKVGDRRETTMSNAGGPSTKVMLHCVEVTNEKKTFNAFAFGSVQVATVTAKLNDEKVWVAA